MYCHAQLLAVRCSPETSAKSKEQSHMGQAEAPAYALGTMPASQYHKAKVTEHEEQRGNHRPCRGGRFTLQAKDYANNRHQGKRHPRGLARKHESGKDIACTVAVQDRYKHKPQGRNKDVERKAEYVYRKSAKTKFSHKRQHGNPTRYEDSRHGTGTVY